jgi:hypothetical protein
MAYTKQTWTDNVSVLSAARFNHMEDGIEKAGRVRLDITVDTGVVAGDFIYKDGPVWKIDNTTEQKLGTHIYDGLNAITLGLMDKVSDAADVDYSLFIQTNGKLGVGATTIPAAKILSTTQIFVDFNPVNTKPKAYTDNMIQFFAIPGISGKIRLKVEKPATAEGVMIRRSDTDYDDSGTSWGDFVADITDDVDYKDVNAWYVDDDGGANLSNGTKYYYKAFLYVGGMHNVADGENETACTAGILFMEHDGDHVTGAVSTDTAGSLPATLTGMVVDAVKVGSGFKGTGTGKGTFTPFDMTNKTLVMYIKTNSNNSGWFGGYAGGFSLFSYGDILQITTHSSAWAAALADASLGVFLELYCSSKNDFTAYINGAFHSNPHISDTRGNTMVTGIGYINVAAAYQQNGDSDQIRVFNGMLTAADRANLYNGGAGC